MHFGKKKKPQQKPVCFCDIWFVWYDKNPFLCLGKLANFKTVDTRHMHVESWWILLRQTAEEHRASDSSVMAFRRLNSYLVAALLHIGEQREKGKWTYCGLRCWSQIFDHRDTYDWAGDTDTVVMTGVGKDLGSYQYSKLHVQESEQLITKISPG